MVAILLLQAAGFLNLGPVFAFPIDCDHIKHCSPNLGQDRNYMINNKASETEKFSCVLEQIAYLEKEGEYQVVNKKKDEINIINIFDPLTSVSVKTDLHEMKLF